VISASYSLHASHPPARDGADDRRPGSAPLIRVAPSKAERAVPRHECDFATPSERHDASEGGADGTSFIASRSVFREGWYVRQADTPRHTGEGIRDGLRRAFPLPVSGAFQDLIEALDRADRQERPSGKADKP
jgi:hypothetical protein